MGPGASQLTSSCLFRYLSLAVTLRLTRALGRRTHCHYLQKSSGAYWEPGVWMANMVGASTTSLPHPWVQLAGAHAAQSCFPQPRCPPCAWQIQPNRVSLKCQKHPKEQCVNPTKLKSNNQSVFSPRDLALMRSQRWMNKSRWLFAL